MLSSRVGTVSCPGVDGHILPCAERCHMSGVRVSNVQRVTSVVMVDGVSRDSVNRGTRASDNDDPMCILTRTACRYECNTILFSCMLSIKMKDAHITRCRTPESLQGRYNVAGPRL